MGIIRFQQGKPEWRNRLLGGSLPSVTFVIGSRHSPPEVSPGGPPARLTMSPSQAGIEADFLMPNALMADKSNPAAAFATAGN